jgi:hypothetical protein
MSALGESGNIFDIGGGPQAEVGRLVAHLRLRNDSQGLFPQLLNDGFPVPPRAQPCLPSGGFKSGETGL